MPSMPSHQSRMDCARMANIVAPWRLVAAGHLDVLLTVTGHFKWLHGLLTLTDYILTASLAAEGPTASPPGSPHGDSRAFWRAVWADPRPGWRGGWPQDPWAPPHRCFNQFFPPPPDFSVSRFTIMVILGWTTVLGVHRAPSTWRTLHGRLAAHPQLAAGSWILSWLACCSLPAGSGVAHSAWSGRAVHLALFCQPSTLASSQGPLLWLGMYAASKATASPTRQGEAQISRLFQPAWLISCLAQHHSLGFWRLRVRVDRPHASHAWELAGARGQSPGQAASSHASRPRSWGDPPGAKTSPRGTAGGPMPTGDPPGAGVSPLRSAGRPAALAGESVQQLLEGTPGQVAPFDPWWRHLQTANHAVQCTCGRPATPEGVRGPRLHVTRSMASGKLWLGWSGGGAGELVILFPLWHRLLAFGDLCLWAPQRNGHAKAAATRMSPSGARDLCSLPAPVEAYRASFILRLPSRANAKMVPGLVLLNCVPGCAGKPEAGRAAAAVAAGPGSRLRWWAGWAGSRPAHAAGSAGCHPSSPLRLHPPGGVPSSRCGKRWPVQLWACLWCPRCQPSILCRSMLGCSPHKQELSATMAPVAEQYAGVMSQLHCMLVFLCLQLTAAESCCCHTEGTTAGFEDGTGERKRNDAESNLTGTPRMVSIQARHLPIQPSAYAITSSLVNWQAMVLSA